MDGRAFKGRVWDVFDPAYVANILASDEPCFPGQREVLQRAFFAWIVAPDDQIWIRDAIVIGCITVLLSHNDSETVLWVSGKNVSSEFSHYILKPIGGLAQILTSRSKKTFTSELSLKSAELTTLAALVNIVHIASGLDPEKYHPPSFRKAAESLLKIYSPIKGEHRMSALHLDLYKPRAAQTVWQQSRICSALVYTSQTVEWRSKRPVFGPIWRTGYVNLSPSLWRTWLAKCRYVAEGILSKMPNKGSDSGAFFLPSIAAEEFSPVVDNSLDMTVLRATFKKTG